MKNRKKFWEGAGHVSEDLIAHFAMFTAGLAGLIYLIRPHFRKHKKLDLSILDFVQSHTNERNTKIMSAITFFGGHKFFIPANLSLIYFFLFVRRRSWFSIRIISISISSLAIMLYLKALFTRKRPLNPVGKAKGLSFPSGHAMTSVTFYGLLIYIILQTVKDRPLKVSLIILLIALIQVIGFSRVYLRVHYASDVVVGYTAGALWLFLSLDVLKAIEEYTNEINENAAFDKQLNF